MHGFDARCGDVGERGADDGEEVCAADGGLDGLRQYESDMTVERGIQRNVPGVLRL